jgi:hypothetical protein
VSRPPPPHHVTPEPCAVETTGMPVAMPSTVRDAPPVLCGGSSGPRKPDQGQHPGSRFTGKPAGDTLLLMTRTAQRWWPGPAVMLRR